LPDAGKSPVTDTEQ
jgi:hypothetical protein